MDRLEIQKLLGEQYAAFIARLRQMSEKKVHEAAPGKWSPAQQAEHLVKSVNPVTLAFGMPAFLLKVMFGKANRPSRTYDELVARYKAKLAAGGRAPSPFVPGVPADAAAVYARLDKTVEKLRRRLQGFRENQLDELIIPHPLLGKLTLREMLYFTAYHAEHHRKAIESTHPLT